MATMRATLLTVAMLGSLACASMTERIVHDAMQGLVWEADYVPREGGDPAALAALYAHLTGLRIEVQYRPADDPELRGAYGVSCADGNHAVIKLRQDLSINGSIEVLAHEAAHLFQPPTLTRSEGDIFAEIVSAHIATRLGVPHAARTSARWLRQYKPRLRMALDLQNEIQYVANLLTPGSGAKRIAAPGR